MKMGAGGIITKFQCVIDNAVLSNLVAACFQWRDSQVLADRLTIVADASCTLYTVSAAAAAAGRHQGCGRERVTT